MYFISVLFILLLSSSCGANLTTLEEETSMEHSSEPNSSTEDNTIAVSPGGASAVDGNNSTLPPAPFVFPYSVTWNTVLTVADDLTDFTQNQYISFSCQPSSAKFQIRLNSTSSSNGSLLATGDCSHQYDGVLSALGNAGPLAPTNEVAVYLDANHSPSGKFNFTYSLHDWKIEVDETTQYPTAHGNTVAWESSASGRLNIYSMDTTNLQILNRTNDNFQFIKDAALTESFLIFRNGATYNAAISGDIYAINANLSSPLLVTHSNDANNFYYEPPPQGWSLVNDSIIFSKIESRGPNSNPNMQCGFYTKDIATATQKFITAIPFASPAANTMSTCIAGAGGNLIVSRVYNSNSVQNVFLTNIATKVSVQLTDYPFGTDIYDLQTDGQWASWRTKDGAGNTRVFVSSKNTSAVTEITDPTICARALNYAYPAGLRDIALHNGKLITFVRPGKNIYYPVSAYVYDLATSTSNTVQVAATTSPSWGYLSDGYFISTYQDGSKYWLAGTKLF